MTSASDDGAALAATRKPPRPTTTTWCTTCLRAGRGLQRAPRLSSVAPPAPMVIASSGPCRRARASGSAVCSPRRRCPPSPLLRFSGLGSDVSLVPRAGLGAFAGSLPAFRSRRAAMHVSSRLLASGALAALERLLGALLSSRRPMRSGPGLRRSFGPYRAHRPGAGRRGPAHAQFGPRRAGCSSGRGRPPSGAGCSGVRVDRWAHADPRRIRYRRRRRWMAVRPGG